MSELSYLASKKVQKANLGPWTRKQVTNHHSRHSVESPLSLYVSLVSIHSFLLFILIFIQGQHFFIMSMHHLKIMSGLITLRKEPICP